MNTEPTAIRLAEKLRQLTVDGKISWKFKELRPENRKPRDAYIAELSEESTSALIAETKVAPGVASYSLFLASNGETFFEVFAEGYPADPSEEKFKMHAEFQALFNAARDNARQTAQKVEEFEQLLQRLA